MSYANYDKIDLIFALTYSYHADSTLNERQIDQLVP